jgi:hypothetical protein
VAWATAEVHSDPPRIATIFRFARTALQVKVLCHVQLGAIGEYGPATDRRFAEPADGRPERS